MLTDSLTREAKLSAVGRATQHARIVDSLSARLMTEDQIRRHPEIEDEELGDPVVIVGLMRSGTTRLHRLLGAGLAFQVAKWWELRYPAPFPGSDWRRDDPRVRAAHEEVKGILAAVPVLAAVHPWDAEAADEEVMILEHAFQSWVPESGAHVPGYSAWLDGQDLTGAYRYLARLLRFIQWQKKQSGRWQAEGGRWILKSPFHLAHIDVLLDVFPGARVIQTHRDPLETIPSAASMVRALRALSTDEVDPRLCGEYVRDRFGRALIGCLRSREKQPGDRFLDVDYRAGGRDPIGEARRVYDWLGLEPTPGAEIAMHQWMQENAREKRSAHEYGLEEFGFTREGLSADFAEYRQRYILEKR